MITATWDGNDLVGDDGATLATFRPAQTGSDGTLEVGGTHIAVTHSAGAMRWEVAGETAAERFTVRMQGVGVGTLTARCGDRRYRLSRTGLLSKKRELIDATSTITATTTPRGAYSLSVEVKRDLPLVDLAFLTWALTLIDVPARRTLT